MRFSYCPDCGSHLILKEIGDEGLVPFCRQCDRPWFDMFSTCVIGLIVNGDDTLLLRQNYLSTTYRTLVSGYMKPGESAEEAMRRETLEETGLTLGKVELIGTYWFERSGVLMIGFIAHTDQTEFTLSGEVDEAFWVPLDEALALVHPPGTGSVSPLLVETELLRRTAQN